MTKFPFIIRSQGLAKKGIKVTFWIQIYLPPGFNQEFNAKWKTVGKHESRSNLSLLSFQQISTSLFEQIHITVHENKNVLNSTASVGLLHNEISENILYKSFGAQSRLLIFLPQDI